MKFLIIEQDLRVSGTSQGIISRSFIAKLRKTYPQSIIDVIYLKTKESDDHLHLLPVNSIHTYIVNLKIPLLIKLVDKINWRLFHVSLIDKYIYKAYASYIAKVDYEKYNHIFIRSAGLDHEIILACKDLPILKKAIVNFHDPFPLFWYPGSKQKLTNLELFKIKNMYEVVLQAKTCTTSAILMSQDLEFLYGSRKKFYTLPHQYDESVFSLKIKDSIISKKDFVSISYHGALMFGRNLDILLEVYKELITENNEFNSKTDFVLRVKGDGIAELKNKYKDIKNIKFLQQYEFQEAAFEQKYDADILIILENGPVYSNTLLGKIPFISALNKPILSISPERSELRVLLDDKRYIADCNNKIEIKSKLKELIIKSLIDKEPVSIMEKYFSDENFKIMLERILLN